MTTQKTPPRSWDVDDLFDLGRREGIKAKYLKAVPTLILAQWERAGRKEEARWVGTGEIARRLVSSGLVPSFKPKGTSVVLSALTRIQGARNLAPPLIEYQGKGRFLVNLPHYEPLLQEYCQEYRERYPEDYKKLFPIPSEEPRWETPPLKPGNDKKPSDFQLESLGIIQVLKQYDRAWQERLEESETKVRQLQQEIEKWRERQKSLTKQAGGQFSFLHTSPDFPRTSYNKKVTSIKETVKQMLQRAKSSIRISTRQIDMFEDDLIRLKEQNSALNITVLSRGPEKAEGARRAIAGRAFERMKAAGIRLPIETDLLHSRMVIVDEREVLVSSADLDYTQMEKEFNAGIWTSNLDVATEATRFFDNLLQSPTIKGS